MAPGSGWADARLARLWADELRSWTAAAKRGGIPAITLSFSGHRSALGALVCRTL